MDESMVYTSRGGFNASQNTIKNRVNAIEQNTMQLTHDLNENKREGQILRSECANLEHQMTEGLNDLLKAVFEDISNLEKDFRKIQYSDQNEMTFLKQQHQQLL